MSIHTPEQSSSEPYNLDDYDFPHDTNQELVSRYNQFSHVQEAVADVVSTGLYGLALPNERTLIHETAGRLTDFGSHDGARHRMTPESQATVVDYLIDVINYNEQPYAGSIKSVERTNEDRNKRFRRLAGITEKAMDAGILNHVLEAAVTSAQRAGDEASVNQWLDQLHVVKNASDNKVA